MSNPLIWGARWLSDPNRKSNSVHQKPTVLRLPPSLCSLPLENALLRPIIAARFWLAGLDGGGGTSPCAVVDRAKGSWQKAGTGRSQMILAFCRYPVKKQPKESQPMFMKGGSCRKLCRPKQWSKMNRQHSKTVHAFSAKETAESWAKSQWKQSTSTRKSLRAP